MATRIEGRVISVHWVFNQTVEAAQHTPGEVSVHELSVTDGFTDHPADELEVVQMVHVDHAQGVGLESRTVCRCCEERVVRVEDLSGQH